MGGPSVIRLSLGGYAPQKSLISLGTSLGQITNSWYFSNNFEIRVGRNDDSVDKQKQTNSAGVGQNPAKPCKTWQKNWQNREKTGKKNGQTKPGKTWQIWKFRQIWVWDRPTLFEMRHFTDINIPSCRGLAKILVCYYWYCYNKASLSKFRDDDKGTLGFIRSSFKSGAFHV